MERIAFLPFENLSGDAALDWLSRAGPQVVTDQLLGGAVVPLQAAAIRDAYASGATRLVHGYFEKRRESVHFEFVVEDARTHKAVENVSASGNALPVLDQLARKLDPGAHAFSSANPQAVAAWGRGQYEEAVSLDPDFGAAWLSWAQSLATAKDTAQASMIAARALARSSLRSPADRLQLQYLSASLHQDAQAADEALSALARLMPHDLSLLRRLAAEQMATRRFSDSAKSYQALLQEEPDDIESWNQLAYAQALAGDVESAQKSLERYGRDPAHAANALDSRGETLFLNGKFGEAEKNFLQAHDKNSAMLGGGDLLKAAYARWLGGDLPGADHLFGRYLAFRTEQKDPLVSWRQAVWEYATGREPAAIAHLSSVTSPPAANVARAQLAQWMDLSKLPQDPAVLKQAYEHAPPAADGLARVLYAAALARTGQKDEARKLLVLWPLPGSDSDPLLQSLVFPKYLELKRELK